MAAPGRRTVNTAADHRPVLCPRSRDSRAAEACAATGLVGRRGCRLLLGFCKVADLYLQQTAPSPWPRPASLRHLFMAAALHARSVSPLARSRMKEICDAAASLFVVRSGSAERNKAAEVALDVLAGATELQSPRTAPHNALLLQRGMSRSSRRRGAAGCIGGCGGDRSMMGMPQPLWRLYVPVSTSARGRLR